MHSRWAHLAAAAGLTVAVASAGVLVGASTADAAEPVIIGSCATTVQGAPGTAVELSPSAVVAPITNLINAVPLLGPPLAAPFKSSFDALPPIPIGALPTGSGTITGGQIANAVVAQLNKLPLLGPILGTLVGGVQSTLTGLCGVTVTGVNAVTAPVQDGTAGIASASQQAQQSLGLAPKSTGTGTGGTGGGGTVQSGGGGSGGGGAATGGGSLPGSNSPVIGGLPADYDNVSWPSELLGIGSAESPLARYAGIPFASAGLFAPAPGVRYGGDVAGYTPGFGVLGQNGSGGSLPGDDIQTAGHAEALGGFGSGPGGIGLPMLLAVLALSGLTAAFVRTWVLRRVPLSPSA
ncbi:MAG TPA: hypothetical protein VHW44_00270 [Pseudonocardiaceae bacterium]|nr:hypothetical protein [Pseudonocardiaceae bacterium]